MRTAQSKLIAFVLTAGLMTACAARSADIGEVKMNPGRFADKTVSVEGVVTESWGIPLVPYKMYKVDDGTGEITILANDDQVPTKGARVRVKGEVQNVATLGGRALGLHLRQRDLDFVRQLP